MWDTVTLAASVIRPVEHPTWTGWQRQGQCTALLSGTEFAIFCKIIPLVYKVGFCVMESALRDFDACFPFYQSFHLRAFHLRVIE